jgi:uncharacterized protein (TIGR02757 family)
VDRKEIERIFTSYHHHRYLTLDPLCCVRPFAAPHNRLSQGVADTEIAALIAAVLAYGRVERIIDSVEKVFSLMEYQPARFTTETSLREKRRVFSGFIHRFNTGGDIAVLLEAVKRCLDEYGSLESCFMMGYHCSHDSIKKGLTDFTQRLNCYAVECAGRFSDSFSFLLSSPGKGSACKRMNMLLRWLVRRNDSIDLGLWQGIDTKHLVIPLDTHTASVARKLSLTLKNTPSWAMAEEITENLKKIDPSDPVKYDFSLCRWGMISFRKES